MNYPLSLGVDIGSTTAKLVLMDGEKIIYQKYERHLSQVRQKTFDMVREIEPLLRGKTFTAAISGSAGMGLAEAAGIPFVQEVYATGETVRALEPDAGTVIELGGEDAKVIFFKGGVDERMNGSCAGGTGAFIDQMATLLDMPVSEMDRLSLAADRIYPIASRCGVFAKTDIQPLLNQGALKSDVAASIYQAVVNQTIAGLIQGRTIEKKVLFLGGPLHYCQGLRRRFVETLKLTGDEAVFPEYDRFAVAIGASLYARSTAGAFTYESLSGALEKSLHAESHAGTLPPLFKSDADYRAFAERHARASVPEGDIASYTGKAYLGIDCGSTTTKLVLLDENRRILYSYYGSNRANPVEILREQLKIIYEKCLGRIAIAGSAVTGYGEELIKNAFGVDIGLVETIAHFTAARYFRPNVDFIIDIGGQDIKCFKIRAGAIDSITLNEACSSGCGSFIETFARSMGCTVSEFAKLGLKSKAPVNLGSRCTVFMNSSVKQAQKDGASVENISAGLSISVVKNALYKVIRAVDSKAIGQEIVVQGGTFLNDAVLRAFEQEIGHDVIRPTIAGLMGAYGAALYAREKACAKGGELPQSTLLPKDALEVFTHSVKAITCRGCSNNCKLTVNTFSGGRKFISGNRCEKPVTGVKSSETKYNMFEEKRKLLARYTYKNTGKPVIGIPMGLNMYELLPFWYKFFTTLGYDVMTSPASNRQLYLKGQHTIPSDTACFPAKLMHGHVEALLDAGVDAIFYPCMTYNLDENLGDNHSNCPVVAYYPEVISSNIPKLKETVFIGDYVGLHRRRDFPGKMYEILRRHLKGDFTKQDVKKASDAAYAEYDLYMRAIRAIGDKFLKIAEEQNKPVIVLSGRPYHVDPEINHGIDGLICDCGAVLVTEDAVSNKVEKFPTTVLNQWTYHSRLYAAAKYVADRDDKRLNLIQLVSFGCGVDAITTDEVRAILHRGGRIYTQLKIDEITNLGAVRIRLRSLFAALDLL